MVKVGREQPWCIHPHRYDGPAVLQPHRIVESERGADFYRLLLLSRQIYFRVCPIGPKRRTNGPALPRRCKVANASPKVLVVERQ